MDKYEVANGYICYGEDDCDDDAIVIEDIEVYERRKGTGRQLINKVIEASEGKKITLCAYPTCGDMELKELISFYEACGFTLDWDDGNCAIMVYHNK